MGTFLLNKLIQNIFTITIYRYKLYNVLTIFQFSVLYFRQIVIFTLVCLLHYYNYRTFRICCFKLLHVFAGLSNSIGSISMWQERWLSCNAKFFGILYLIFALFSGLISMGYSILIKLE